MSEPRIPPPQLRPTAYLLYHPADAEVALALQRGLEQFSKARGERKAVDVLADLSAASNEESPWLVMVTSVAAAESDQYNRELEDWLGLWGPSGLLPVVVGEKGQWTWDSAAGDFAWDTPKSVECVPPKLRRVLADEPRHLMLSPSHESAWFTLKNDGFKDQVADLAATIRAVAKDQLEDEDRRRQLRRSRLAAGGAAVLVALVAAFGGLAALAVGQQEAVVDQRVLVDEATMEAEENTVMATSAELAGFVLAATEDDAAGSQRLDAALLDVLAATAYALDEDSESIASMGGRFDIYGSGEVNVGEFTVSRNAFVERYKPLETDDEWPLVDEQGGSIYRPLFQTEGTTTIRRTTGFDRPIERVDVEGIEYVAAMGAEGRWIVAFRQPTGTPMLFDYDDAAALPANTFRSANLSVGWTADPAAGPTPCSDIIDDACLEPVIIDLVEGRIIPLRAELVVADRAVDPADSSWPDPVSQHRFSPSGRHLLSHDTVIDQLVLTDTTTGLATTVWSEGDAKLSDFGVIDDERGWRLHGTDLTIFSLRDPSAASTYELESTGFGRPVSAAVSFDGRRAFVGFEPANLVIVELESMTATTPVPVGGLLEELVLGPNERWLAAAGDGFYFLIDAESRTIVNSADIRVARVTLGIDEAEFSFSPSGDRLTMRSSSGANLARHTTVIKLDPDEWQRALCRRAGREPTAEEWRKYVGALDQVEVCSDFADSEKVAAPQVTVREDDSSESDDDELDSGASVPAEIVGVLKLGPGGIDGVSFGVDEATVVAALTEKLGQPSDRWSCELTTGCGPHDPLGTFINWPELSLFVDANTMTFSYFGVQPAEAEAPMGLVASTPEGVGIGSSVSDVLAVYPDSLAFVGCTDGYESIYEAVDLTMVMGRIVVDGSLYEFAIDDGVVTFVGHGTRAIHEFNRALSCAP